MTLWETIDTAPMPWVALIGPEIEENLGLRYLSSSLRLAGFATAIIPFNFGEDLAVVLGLIRSVPQQPLLIALSLSFQRRATDCMALVMALREAGYAGHITGGGHFGYFCRRELLRDFNELDSLCHGEAEEVMVDLARALHEGGRLSTIPGLSIRRSDGSIEDTPGRAAPDIASLPWPDRRGRRSSCCGHRIASIVGGRGCYGNCAFCCIAAWHRSNRANRPFRFRPVNDVADEMVSLHHDQAIDIFVFHDDNFFLPDKEETLRRILSLADAVESRGLCRGRFATAVKARPTDITPDVVRVMKERFGLYRLFLGVENDSSQGLATLRRGVERRSNHDAIETLIAGDIYTCFNLLLFDPDTTMESFADNLDFMSRYGSNPFFFGRVELYAGTPLLARMQQEGRCTGDYFAWDYRLRDHAVQRMLVLTMRCFYDRNYPPDSPVNRLQSARHDVEVCRFFHPGLYMRGWRSEVDALCQELAGDTVARLKAIAGFVKAGGPARDADELVEDFSRRMRRLESRICKRADLIRREVQAAVGASCCHAQPSPGALEIGQPLIADHPCVKECVL